MFNAFVIRRILDLRTSGRIVGDSPNLSWSSIDAFNAYAPSFDLIIKRINLIFATKSIQKCFRSNKPDFYSIIYNVQLLIFRTDQDERSRVSLNAFPSWYQPRPVPAPPWDYGWPQCLPLDLLERHPGSLQGSFAARVYLWIGCQWECRFYNPNGQRSPPSHPPDLGWSKSGG